MVVNVVAFHEASPWCSCILRQGHKKEIREREETIADKEKRIYDLKKKNQEVRTKCIVRCGALQVKFSDQTFEILQETKTLCPIYAALELFVYLRRASVDGAAILIQWDSGRSL